MIKPIFRARRRNYFKLLANSLNFSSRTERGVLRITEEEDELMDNGERRTAI